MSVSQIHPQRVRALAARTMACPTAPYREGAVIAWVREFAAGAPSLLVREDNDGNLELRRRGVPRSRAPLVFNAHMDHPGFRALRSTRGRRAVRIDALFLGGVRPEFFPGAHARFFASDGADAAADTVRARVVEARPDRRSGELRVRLEARHPVRRGAFGMWDLPAFRENRAKRGLRLEGRVADDLAGVTAILALFERLERIDPARRIDVRAVLTRAEEVGFVGALAIASAGRLPPGARVIAVEASKALPNAPRGAGPIVRVGDRSSVFDDGLTRWVDAVARDLAASRGSGRFRYQRRLMDGGTCESTAYQQYGYRTTGICLPLANYHNMSERGTIAAEAIDFSDLVGLVRLFEGMVRRDRECPRRGSADPLRKRLDALYRRSRAQLRRDPFA